MKTLLALLGVAALVVTFVWERKAIATLRLENESLRIEKRDAERLAVENRDLPTVQAAATAAAIEPGAATELLRLRNEVSSLRRQQPEIARLRAENERIGTELKSGEFRPRRLADMEGFMPRANWANAGFATPEAAAQSIFAGITSGDIEQFIRCFDPRAGDELRQRMGDNPEEMRRELAETASQFGKATGLRIIERRQEADDRVALKLQLSAEGEAITLLLRRAGNEWKADKERALEIGP